MPTFLVPAADVHGLSWRRALGQSDTPRRSPERVRYLIAYDWPGNIRELRNHADCRALAIPPDAEDRAARPKSGMTLSEVVETFERALIGGIAASPVMWREPRCTISPELLHHGLRIDRNGPALPALINIRGILRVMLRAQSRIALALRNRPPHW